MSEKCEHSNPLTHSGTSQKERLLQMLDPSNVELHGLNEEDWMQFARQYARRVQYFSNHNEKSGNWQDFFPAKDEIESLLERYGDGDVEPHLALFISFLKLLNHPQQSLNGLPKRHLDFYYREVLKIEKKSPISDQVHILFELAKNASSELIEEGVELKAGKDSEGNPLVYKTVNPVVVNHAKVARLQSVYVDDEGALRYAPVVNSADGKGAKFEGETSWWAFGESKAMRGLETDNPERWAKSELIIYLASPLFELKEGEREIILDFTFSSSSGLGDVNASNIEAWFTGEKGWLDSVTAEFDSGDSTRWKFTLDKGYDAVTAYEESVHESNLEVHHPVIKIRISPPQAYTTLNNTKIESINIIAKVSGIESLKLQNDLGGLDPTKPFMPFGSRPKVGSKLSVVYPEMFKKPVSKFGFDMRWLNLPANFSEHYKKYKSAISSKREHYKTVINTQKAYNSLFYYNPEWENDIPMLKDINGNGNGAPVADTMRKNFKFKISSPYQNSSESAEMFTDSTREVIVSDENKKISHGEIELILTESFYHDLYSELYVNAVLEGQESNTVDLPNEPYTPLLDTFTLSYTAEDSVSFKNMEAVGDQASVMFHQHPFGVRQVTAERKTLLPEYEAGVLFIGMEKVQPGSNVSLLFQVDEGSENPLHSSLTSEDVKWSILAGNNWLSLDNNFARNETNHFLRSGIAELAIPQQADASNTLMKKGLFWLRIQLKKPFDSVPRFVNVHAQVAKAEFWNQNNSTEHLDQGLPTGTIGKLLHPRAHIKSIEQPYASFGGEPAESDDDYYRRISERLRHKNRSVSIWDYEHLVLQEFPSLYKVKCLNHASWDGIDLDQLSPGSVTMILIPKVAGATEDFRLKPRVSQDLKDQVESFIRQISSPHAQFKAVNAVYEPVQFKFKVRFREGLDYNYYKTKTVDDLKRLIAPWVYESAESLQFGGTYTEYEIVNFLENRAYIDFIEDFYMYHQPYGGNLSKTREAKPSIPMAILVPHGNHGISKAAEGCTA